MTPSVAALAAVGLIFAIAANAEQIRTFTLKSHSKCRIYDVFIDPCPQALENKPCEIAQQVNASIRFKYVSEFSTKIPKTRLYAETAILDMPFMDMDTNACLYTECPIVANVERTWSYQLYISEFYPRNRYSVKLKYWNDEPDANPSDMCAFSFNMKIVSSDQ